jgi:hypothetical protein
MKIDGDNTFAGTTMKNTEPLFLLSFHGRHGAPWHHQG